VADHETQHAPAELIGANRGRDGGEEIEGLRGPDIAFLSAQHLPDPRPVGYIALPPDLVIEVLSTHDRPGEVLAKVGDWLESGAQLVWVIDPVRRQARIYRRDGTEAGIGEIDSLDGEDVVPGFTCRLAEVL